MDELEPTPVDRPRTFIGGRHGSPTVTIALPFSNITSHDSEMRSVLSDLALLVARLARATESATDVDMNELAAVRAAAEAIAAELA